MTLYILSYNNYFNRQLKKLDTVADYLPFLSLQIDNVSFNPNDGITTSQIVNKYDKGNYLICSEDNVSVSSRWFIIEANRTRQGQYNLQLKRDSLADNLDSIKDAPLFVEKAMLEDDDPMIVNDEGMQTNKVKIRETLLKDATKVPWIVGYISPNTGTEDIKVTADESASDTVSLSEIAVASGIPESTLSDFIGYDNKEPTKFYGTNSMNLFYENYHQSTGMHWRSQLNIDGDLNCYGAERTRNPEFKDNPLIWDTAGTSDVKEVESAFRYAINANKDTIHDYLSVDSKRGYYINKEQIDILYNYSGKLVTYLDGVYKFNIINNGTPTTKYSVNGSIQSFIGFNTAFKTAALPTGSTYKETGHIRIDFNDDEYAIKLEAISKYGITTSIPEGRRKLKKEVFNMFCMPAEDILVHIDGNKQHTFISQGSINRKIATAVRTQLDAGCYDIQLLPYCPIPNVVKNGKLYLNGLENTKDYNFVTPETTQIKTFKLTCSKFISQGASGTTLGSSTFVGKVTVPEGYYGAIKQTFTFDNNSGHEISDINVGYGTDSSGVTDYSQLIISFDLDYIEYQGYPLYSVTFTVTMSYIYKYVGIMFWCTENSFKVNLDYNLSLEHSMKIDSNLCSYRLCSPNYQGSFEFNVAKNGGAVNGFRADCTYKPYNPYIRVYPNFDWLYGTDFGDGRGLICGGDFSLPQVSDAWVSYQLQNKNYQNTFNRDIQSLDYNNSIALRNQKIGMFTGAFSDAAKGAGLGAMVGKGLGGAIGGVVGGFASLIGGIADTDTMVKQQREQRQLSIDKFNYQLGNIQALPYTISKVGTFDINSKVFPFLEFYTCTDQELEAFENKIKYESMTVMRIGTLEEFKKTDMSYIKGSLIRLDISDDSNLVNDIYSELYKGVYY